MSANRETVLDFISNFRDTQETFLNGCCFWFAFILQERFGGTMMYLPVENHFVQAIGKRLYDVSGDVTPKYLCSQIIPWETIEQYDSSLYRKLVRDCIKKERFDYDNDSG